MDFESLCERVLEEVAPYTMVAAPPLRFTIVCALDAIEQGLPGDIVECGTWLGGCSFAMLLAQRYRYGKILKPVWMCDSFDGLEPATVRDGPLALAWQADTESPNYVDNCRAPLDRVMAASAAFGFSEAECKIVPGWFADTLPTIAPKLATEGIALLRVDCDWYEPVLLTLETLAGAVCDEGKVILDDYYAWDGCARATHTYLARHDLAYRIRSLDGFGAAWFEKRAARVGGL